MNQSYIHISFYTNPEANFYPPHEFTAENKILEGFSWRVAERPTRQSVLNFEKKEILPEIEQEKTTAVEAGPKKATILKQSRPNGLKKPARRSIPRLKSN